MDEALKDLEELFPYKTSLQGSILIMRALNEASFQARALQWFSSQAPHVVEEMRRMGYEIRQIKAKKAYSKRPDTRGSKIDVKR